MQASILGKRGAPPEQIEGTGPKKIQQIDRRTSHLKEEINALQAQILNIEMPDGCPLKQREERIASLMEQAKEPPSVNDTELTAFGKKHESLIQMSRLLELLKLDGIEVPKPYGISTKTVEELLGDITTEWSSLNGLYMKKSSYPLLKRNAVKVLLKKIAVKLSVVSEKESCDEQFLKWLSDIESKKEYIMVRSSGNEDTLQAANAGGNISCPYIAPQREPLCKAISKVVKSYSSLHSLQNLINAGVNPFAQKPNLSLTAQRLIGETPIAYTTKTDSADLPISLVLFTSEPLYTHGEKFRAMRISATYGHGEGVVGGVGIGTDTILILVSVTNPEKLYMLYDNVDKPQRLAPVVTNEGIKLLAVNNPPDLRQKPVLSLKMIGRLYTWGVVAEKLFDNHPTDMEIVIKNETIYPVQARPVNRPKVTPTYLNLKRGHAIKKTIRGTVLVGTSSVVVATQPNEICFAQTLAQAETLYNNKTHKAVVVLRPEPANSHPVVNFSSLGVPCIYVTDSTVEALINQTTSDSPFVVCTQEGTVNVWDEKKKQVQKFISSGFTAHPAKIAISLPCGVSQKISGKPKEVPEDVKELLLRVRAERTGSIALKMLEQLKRHTFVTGLSEQETALHQQMLKQTFIPDLVTEIHSVLKHLIQTITMAFAETAAALKTEGRLHALFHIKVLNTWLLNQEDGIGRYSRITIDPYLAGATELIGYQKKFNHKARFAQIYLAGNQAFDPSSKTAWRQFLEEIEKTTVPLEKEQRLVRIIQVMQRSDVLATWFALFFKGGTLDQVLETLPVEDEQKIIEAIEIGSSIKVFGAFDSTRKESLYNLAQMVKGASPVATLAILSTMLQAVDLYDSAIKQMKARSDLDQEEKALKFKEMLTFLFSLLSSWTVTLRPYLSFSMANSWTIRKYLSSMESILENLPADRNSLQPSPDFSVVAAILGAATDYSRHLPMTLEDFFTMTHQNFLAIVSNCAERLVGSDLLNESLLPSDLKETLKAIEVNNSKMQRTGITITSDQIQVKYNIPLRSHSAQVVLKYDKENPGTKMHVFFLGLGRTRWNSIAFSVNLFDQFEILRLNEPIHLAALEVNFSWNIRSGTSDLKTSIEEFDWLCDVSSGHTDLQINDRLGYPHKITPQRILEHIKTKKELNRHEENLYKEITFAQAIEKQAIEMKWETVDAKTGYKLIQLVKKGFFLKEAVIAAKNGYKDNSKYLNTDSSSCNNTFKLFIELVKRGQGFSEATAVVTTLFENPTIDYRHLSSTYELLTCLVREGQACDQAAKFADRDQKSDNSYIAELALGLFTELAKRGQAYNAAFAAVESVMNTDTEDVSDAMTLLSELIQRGVKFPETIELAKKLQSENQVERAFDLFTELGKWSQGVDDALKAIESGLMESAGNSLDAISCALRIAKNRSFGSKLCAMAKKVVEDPNHKGRIGAIALLKALAREGKCLDEASQIVKQFQHDPDARINMEIALLQHELESQGIVLQ